jgi:GNAT superfamily N-acetyltransferase
MNLPDCAGRVRLADPRTDNAALCALARRCPQGRRLRFYHERTDFWERGRLQPACAVLLAEDAGRVVGSVSVGRKSLWFSRRGWQPAAYLFDLMVAPEQRGRGLGRTLVRAAHQACPEAPLFYSHIVEDNVPSRRLFEAEGFTAHARPVLYHILLPRTVRRPLAGLTEEVAPEFAAEVDDVLRCRYDCLDGTAGHDGLFRLRIGSGHAWGALRRHDAQVFVGLPWYAEVLGRLVPGFPRGGRPVRVWSLHHLGGEGADGRRALRRLVGAVAGRAAKEDVDALALPLFANDPLTADVRGVTLTRWGVPPGVARLYVAGELARDVLTAERPLLVSAKDA